MALSHHDVIIFLTKLFDIILYSHNFGMAHSGGLDLETYTDHTGLMVSYF